jgi:large subunit ribosomal protein L23
MKDIHRVLKGAVITEKSNAVKDTLNKYTFRVALEANKIEIRQAIERLFGLKNKVLEVRTSVLPGKYRRKGRKGGFRPDWKKAVVTLAKGVAIKEFDEG